jgi:hypothetical protein
MCVMRADGIDAIVLSVETTNRRGGALMSATVIGHTQLSARRHARLRQLFAGTAKAGAVALVAIELYALVLHAAGLKLRAETLGAHTATPVTFASFAIAIVVATFWAAVAACVIARISTRPVRTFVFIAIVATALSLALPLGAGDTATQTKVALAGGHLLVAALMITLIARQLGRAARSRTS